MKLLVETKAGLKLTQSATETIRSIEKQMEELRKMEEKMKAKIMAQMESHNCKRIENDELAITYVDETKRTTLDSKRIKDELPGIYDRFSKVSKVSACVKISCK